MFRRFILQSYAILLSCLFAIVFTAQVLAFLGFYQPFIAIPTTILIAFLSYWLYQKHGENFQAEFSPEEIPSPTLQMSLICSLILLLGLVFVWRMLLWPYSELGSMIPEDFFTYHGVKILDLFRTGSFWNLAIPYGDYPNGYESLSAFGLFFLNDIRVLGTVHAFILILLWLTAALLLVRYGKIPFAWALFFSIGLFFIPPLYSFILLVGKNDSFLSLTILIAILHAPVGNRNFHPFGLACATMLSLATKATGLYILFYLWGLVLLFWFLAWREGKAKNYFHPLSFTLTLAIMFVGGLWVLRNLAILGSVFTPEVASFFSTSIAANLNNPTIYNSGSESLNLLLGLIFVAVLSLGAYFNKSLGWTVSTLIFVIAFTFVFTPLSAFLTAQKEMMLIQWRFVLHGLLFAAILTVVLLWSLAKPLYHTWLKNAYFSNGLAFLIVAAALAIIILLDPRDLLSYDSSQLDFLTDPHRTESSVYDEVKNLEAAVLYIENADWFRLMYANPSLIVTQGSRYPLRQAGVYPIPVPDYMIFIPLDYQPEPNFADLDRLYEWELIYEDRTGRLYRRLP